MKLSAPSLYSITPAEVWEDRNLKAAAQALYGMLAYFLFIHSRSESVNGNRVSTGIRELKERLHVSQKNLDKAVKALVDGGHIEVVKQDNNRAWYQLNHKLPPKSMEKGKKPYIIPMDEGKCYDV